MRTGKILDCNTRAKAEKPGWESPEFCKCLAMGIWGKSFESLQDQLASPQEAGLATSSPQHLETQPEEPHYWQPLPVFNSPFRSNGTGNFSVHQPGPFWKHSLCSTIFFITAFFRQNLSTMKACALHNTCNNVVHYWASLVEGHQLCSDEGCETV